MNCRSAESLFSAFLDDELNQKERRGLEAHLLSCKRCSLSVRELRVALQFLHAAPEVETSPHFEADVMSRIRSGEAMRPSMIEWFRRRFEPAALRPFFLAGAGACAVWIAVFVTNPEHGFIPGGGSEVASSNPTAVTAPSSGGESRPSSVAPDRATAPANPANDLARAEGSSSATDRPAATRARSADPASEVASLERNSTPDVPADDVAIPNPGARYADEYITDQFYLERQVDGADPGITPVSGRPSDDGYITF